MILRGAPTRHCVAIVRSDILPVDAPFRSVSGSCRAMGAATQSAVRIETKKFCSNLIGPCVLA